MEKDNKDEEKKEKKIFKKKVKKPLFEGKANTAFKIRDKQYNIGDAYSTESESSFNYLLITKRIIK